MIDDPIIRRLHACCIAGVPAVQWGPPGTGKTARMKLYAGLRSAALERWILSRCEPIDLKPRLYVDGKVVVARPPELERLGDAFARGESAMLFLDELNRSSREVVGAALDIIDSPPDGVWVSAACNPPSKGQAARSLESAAANRFCHLDVHGDSEAWARAQVSGWPSVAENGVPVPSADMLDAKTRKASALVSAFIRRHPKIQLKDDSGNTTVAEMFEAEPLNPADAGKAWPSPRSWESAKRVHGAAMALDFDMADTLALVGGCVGEGAAAQYLAFVEAADLPDPEDLLKDPKSFTPERGRLDRTVAVVTSIAGAIDREMTDARWKAAWAIANGCIDADEGDAAFIGADLLMGLYRRKGKGKPLDGITAPDRLLHKRMVDVLVASKAREKR